MFTINLLQSHLNDDLLAFTPELILCGGIVLLLILRMFKALDRVHLGSIALVLTLAALGFSSYQWQSMPWGGAGEIFSGPGHRRVAVRVEQRHHQTVFQLALAQGEAGARAANHVRCL